MFEGIKKHVAGYVISKLIFEEWAIKRLASVTQHQYFTSDQFFEMNHEIFWGHDSYLVKMFLETINKKALPNSMLDNSYISLEDDK
jgi:hypothetical protein